MRLDALGVDDDLNEDTMLHAPLTDAAQRKTAAKALFRRGLCKKAEFDVSGALSDMELALKYLPGDKVCTSFSRSRDISEI